MGRPSYSLVVTIATVVSFFSVWLGLGGSNTTIAQTTKPGSAKPAPPSKGTSSDDQKRAADVGKLRAALKAYRDKRGKFPGPLPDNPVGDLKAELTDFIDTIPSDPVYAGSQKDYHYVSPADGASYGLHIFLDDPKLGHCVTGVDVASGWWRKPPKCPF